MPKQLHSATKVRLSRRMAFRLAQAEAYRRISVGHVPGTLSEFASQLSAWLASAHPGAPAIPASAIEKALRETWDHRHEMTGSDL